MLFDGYPKSEADEIVEKTVMVVPVVVATIATFYLWSAHVGIVLGSRAGVSIALILFAPVFAFFLTESVRFATAVLSALVVLSWPSVWFETLDQLAASSYSQLWLNFNGPPWWDTSVFKATVETAFAAFLGVYLLQHRMIIAGLFDLIRDSWRR